MRFWLLHGDEAIAEIEAETCFAAVADRVALGAPAGSSLVELETGAVVARKGEAAWTFDGERAFDREEARSVA